MKGFEGVVERSAGEVLERLGRGVLAWGGFGLGFVCMELSLAYWRILRSTSILFSARRAEVLVLVVVVGREGVLDSPAPLCVWGRGLRVESGMAGSGEEESGDRLRKSFGSL